MDIPNHIELLVVKYLNGTISRDEYQELTTWLDLSAANRLAFDGLREIWLAANIDQGIRFDSSVAFERFENAVSEAPYTPASDMTSKPMRLTYQWAAAIVVFALLTGILLYYFGQVRVFTEATASYQE